MTERVFFINKTLGKSDKGVWRKICLLIHGDKGDSLHNFFVDSQIYDKCSNLKLFDELEVIFGVNYKGEAVLSDISSIA